MKLSPVVLCLSMLALTGCPPDGPEPPPPQPEPATEANQTESSYSTHTTDAAGMDADFAADRFTTLLDDDERQLFAISRPFGEDMLVIVTNWSDEAHGLRIPQPEPGHYVLAQSTTDEPYRVQSDETGIILEIGARTTLVLRRAEPEAVPTMQ